MMDAIEAIIKRKSVRAYEDRPVPGHVVEKIIEAGQWAPNAGQQIGLRGLQLLPVEYPFQISVITNKGLRRKINDRVLETMNRVGNVFARQRASLPEYQPLFGAPAVVLLSGPDQGVPGAVNAALVAENMLIAATALGLGSCYLGSPAHALTGFDARGRRSRGLCRTVCNHFRVRCTRKQVQPRRADQKGEGKLRRLRTQTRHALEHLITKDLSANSGQENEYKENFREVHRDHHAAIS